MDSIRDRADSREAERNLVFPVAPYAPQEGIHPAGLVLLLASAGVAAKLAAALLSLTIPRLYIVVVFPIATGFLLGGAGQLAIRLGRIRSRKAAWLAAAFAGILTITLTHVFEYRQFVDEQASLSAADRKVLERCADLHRNGEPIARLVERFHADRVVLNDPESRRAIEFDLEREIRALEVESFGDFLQYRAGNGVRVTEIPGVMPRHRVLRLGVAASYAYWLLEILVVVLVAGLVMRHGATRPFCAACQSWKRRQDLGSLGVPLSEAEAVIRSGDLAVWRQAKPTAEPGEVVLAAWTCSRCQGAASVEVLLEHAGANGQRYRQFVGVATVTYPGDALAPLLALFPKARPAASPSDG